MKRETTILPNPITNTVIDLLAKTNKQMLFAVPYISPFAKTLFNEAPKSDKAIARLITRFDSSNLNTFELPTLEFLIKSGFEVVFNNNIHLKLYIFDNESIITSSNLTKGGLEDNFELSVKLEGADTNEAIKVFEELWESSKQNKITLELIKNNMPKYKVLKAQSTNKVADENVYWRNPHVNSKFTDIIEEVDANSEIYQDLVINSLPANKSRNTLIETLITNGFKSSLFFLPPKHKSRKTTLAYNILYGVEKNLAGTGMFDLHFEAVFNDIKFEEVMTFLIPEMIGAEPWDFNNMATFKAFCTGLFDFEIPQYKNTIPIRLASYFYPDIFLPIFKLEELESMCMTLGLTGKPKSKGEKLYTYTIFLQNFMKNVGVNNYVKGRMLYIIKFSNKIMKGVESGKSISQIRSPRLQKWEQSLFDEAFSILKKLNFIKVKSP